MSARPGHRYSPDYRAAVVRLVVERIEGIAEAEVFDLLREVRAWHSHALFDLHDHLIAHPDAFIGGSSDIPLSLLRLVWALRDAGYTSVVAPACVGCRRAVRDMPALRDGGRICVPCYRLQTRTTCARCGRPTKNAYRRAEGIICASCRDAEPQSRGICSGCGYERPLRCRPDGPRLCDTCIPRPIHQCAGCGKSAPAAAVTDAGPLCNWCYHKRFARLCGGCDRIRPIVCAATSTTPDLCLSCRPRLVDVCAGCGRTTYGNRSDRGRGPFLCQTCQPKIRHCCALCGKVRPASAIWPVGPTCRSCYLAAKRRPTGCAGCRETAVLIRLDATGLRICGTCVGVEDDYRCARCHRGNIPFSHGLCERCMLNDQVEQMLRDAHDAEQLAQLAAALRASTNPAATVRWMRSRPTGQLLTRLTGAGEPLTHATLDRLRQAQHVHKLRQVLVRTGVLPERSEYLDRIPPWLSELLRDRPPHHSELVRPYVNWFLLHRARQRTARRPVTPHAAYGIRSHIRTILVFLSWLDARGSALATLTQHDIDAWLDRAPASHYRVRSFVKWAHRHRAAPALILPPDRESPTRLNLVTEEELCQELRRCLHDNNLPLDVRVAGGLLLLFGIRMPRLVQLGVDAVVSHDDNVYLHAGRAPIRIPPPLDRLLNRLAAEPIDPDLISAAVGPSPFLFPGGAPGQPIRTDGMYQRLRRYGITSEPGRQTALLALSADLPAPVVADLLGIHVHTALRWAEYTSPDWASYLNARTSAPDHQPNEP